MEIQKEAGEHYDDPREDISEELALSLRKALGSCSINFLFGAGVNGGAFPYFAQFCRTIKAMNEEGLVGNNIEAALRSCSDDRVRQSVLDVFADEYNGHSDYQLNHKSLINLRRLLVSSSLVVNKAENRHPESKRLNVFTLNYDRIVEEILEDSALFSYTLTGDRSKSHLPFNVVGYDISTRTFVPTFSVYKLHGSVGTDRVLDSESIVFPGQDKLGSVISNFYETLFAMKGELLRKNSALFVIGYSWSDDHVNGIIIDAIASGLTVYWPQYRSSDELPPSLEGGVVVIPPTDCETPEDTTKTLAVLFEKAMRL